MVLVLYSTKIKKTEAEHYQRDRMRERYQSGEYKNCICGARVNEYNLNHKNSQHHRAVLRQLKADFKNFTNS
jgi:hypothetical protein